MTMLYVCMSVSLNTMPCICPAQKIAVKLAYVIFLATILLIMNYSYYVVTV